jgi:hypothetical protein
MKFHLSRAAFMHEVGSRRNNLRPNGKYLFCRNEKLEDAGSNILKTGRFNLIINIIIIIRHELGLDRLVSASHESFKACSELPVFEQILIKQGVNLQMKNLTAVLLHCQLAIKLVLTFFTL